VRPTPIGTTWGLGGTCVNVGCIPKKLMHFAGLIGDLRQDQIEAGWEGIDLNGTHNWEKMVTSVNQHIKELNSKYRIGLSAAKVDYKNALASLVDPHTIELFNPKRNKKETVTARYILIATGGRPSFPEDLPEAKTLAITSDDIFWMKKAPGKTLIVGASYIALECGGFLSAMGYDVTILVRSILLRGFDQDMATRIGK